MADIATTEALDVLGPPPHIRSKLDEYRRIVQEESSEALEDFWKQCAADGVEDEVRGKLRDMATVRALLGR